MFLKYVLEIQEKKQDLVSLLNWRQGDSISTKVKVRYLSEF
jgi:hypothetical protein